MEANALELGVLLSVAAGDLDAFARNVAQLKPNYVLGTPSERKCLIFGLIVMFFFVVN